MKVLLHTCCAPCLSGARIGFEEERIPYATFWYNPNIQPISEHDKRFLAYSDYEISDPFESHGVVMEDRELYSDMMTAFFSGGDLGELGPIEIESRCDICYILRLRRCANEAKEHGFKAFSTTLLLSKYQKHGRIKAIGEALEESIGVEFLYIDLRKFWGKSLDRSRKYRLYRQRYCGCELSLRTDGQLPDLKSVQHEPEVRIEPCYQDKAKDGE